MQACRQVPAQRGLRLGALHPRGTFPAVFHHDVKSTDIFIIGPFVQDAPEKTSQILWEFYRRNDRTDVLKGVKKVGEA